MTPYKPSGRLDAGAVTTLVLGCLAVGAAVGALANGIGSFIRLIILFPLGMGFAVGYVGALLVGWKRVQAPVVAGLIGALGGATAWSTDLVIDYFRERSSVEQQILSMVEEYEETSGESIPRERVGAVVNATFVRWGQGEEMAGLEVFAGLMDQKLEDDDGQPVSPPTPASGGEAAVGWVRARLAVGTQVSRTGGSSGIDVGSMGTAILWGVEILLAAGVAAYMMRSRAAEPYCTTCDLWYADAAGIVPIGDVDAASRVVDALDRDDSALLSSVIRDGGVSVPFVGFRARSCPQCQDAPLYAEVVTVRAGRRRNEEKVVRAGVVPRSVMEHMIEAVDKATGRERTESRDPAAEDES